jgi:hypothetical protein
MDRALPRPTAQDGVRDLLPRPPRRFSMFRRLIQTQTRSTSALLFAMAVLTLAACYETPVSPPTVAPVGSAVTSNEWRDVRLVIDKCDAPDVVVTGRFHEVFWTNEDAAGALHRGFHLNFQLTGEGADGLRYAYSGVQSSVIYFANPPFTDVTELRLRMIAQGSHDDFIQTFRYHQTINANGEITSFLEAATEECGDGASGNADSIVVGP